MTDTNKLLAGVAIGAIAIFALVTLIDVDVSGDLEVPSIEMTDNGDITLPTVDVSGGNVDLPNIETSGGEMPDVDVRTLDVDVVERDAEIEVPTGIETETKSLSIPTLEIEDTAEENTYAEEDDL